MAEVRVCHHCHDKSFLELYLAPTCLCSQLVPVIMGIFLETKLTERTTTPSKDKHSIQRDHLTTCNLTWALFNETIYNQKIQGVFIATTLS